MWENYGSRGLPRGISRLSMVFPKGSTGLTAVVVVAPLMVVSRMQTDPIGWDVTGGEEDEGEGRDAGTW